MRSKPGQPEGRTSVVAGKSGGKVKDQSRAGNALSRVAHYACFGAMHEKPAGRNARAVLLYDARPLRQNRVDTP